MPSSVDEGANTPATIQLRMVISENTAMVVAARMVMTTWRRGTPFVASQHAGHTIAHESRAVDRVIVVSPLNRPAVSPECGCGCRHNRINDAAVAASKGTYSDSFSGCAAMGQNFHATNNTAIGSATFQMCSLLNATAISTIFHIASAASSRCNK